ncbi:MAG: EAL domain-containing protein [Thermoanaerobaculales bacterium]|jgi:diguanylate cyclase (GGDEF)-like protein/PAS domain S-box-containing protein|nr:EAL domain-containing protein [Thermoanaerobaculales bacterium]
MSDTGRCDIVRVLLVEDSPDHADLIRAKLQRSRRLSAAITHAERLDAALVLLQDGGFDVVLLDFSLPDSYGLETFRRAQAVAQRTPIIVLTSLDDNELAVQAVREGAQDYLIKREADTRLLVRSILYAIERKAAADALRDSEERYALAVRGANDGLWDWDLKADRVFFSPRWKAMLGFGDADVGDSPREWLDRIHPDDRPPFRRHLDTHLGGGSDHFEFEHRMRNAAGEYLWVLARGVAERDERGTPYRMAGSQTDITARKRAEHQLQHDALHDGLTGLANRVLFMDRLACALADLQRRAAPHFAVLFFDLDRFKNINDSLGHTLGDKLLVGIARRLEHFLRPGDTVARLGGDEFAILIHRVDDASGAIHVADRIQEILSMTFSIDGHDVMVTASIGIAHSSTGYTNPEEILRDADIAMYRAKAGGKARYEVFDRDMHQSAVTLLRLETELRHSVHRGEFEMHYQPIVSLTQGRIVGFEGLVRWRHPKRGLVTPDQFIAIAEETGLIVPLGWWVLRESCRQTRRWQRQFPADPSLWVSVNMSGKLFMKTDMVDEMLGILEETGLEPRSLRLEVTENVVMDHADLAIRNLMELRGLGVQLSIDDFGTGYSSLSYLQRFHYDSLKIDRSFVSKLGTAGDSRAIVETILNLANSLGIGVVAEGIETAEQVERLRRMQCPHGQGYWFSRPLTVPAAEELMASAPSW